MDFTGCLMTGADERFLARLNHLIPIKETSTIRFGPDLSDPGVLQVSLESGVIRVSGQPVKEAQLVEYLKTHQLAEQHHKVALLMNKDDMPDVGLMISVMDKLKAAGLEHISVVPQ
jgi:biopolymer transport protein ExbD